jgi:hypothetical protein
MYMKKKRESLLEEYDCSLSEAPHYVGTMCIGLSGTVDLNIHQGKYKKFRLGLKWLVNG